MLDKGRKNTNLLIQPQYKPMAVGKQIAILYCGTHGLMRDIDIQKVSDFETLFLEEIELNNPELIRDLNIGILNDEYIKIIEKTAASVSSKLVH
jgi:F-type H+/Na+-transporting ATPase subunit alpha